MHTSIRSFSHILDIATKRSSQESAISKINFLLKDKFKDSQFKYEILVAADKSIEIIIKNTENLLSIPQALIFESARVAAKSTHKNQNIRVYSQKKNGNTKLEFSMEHEIEKHFLLFSKVDKIISIKKTSPINRIAIVNVVRREKLAREFYEENHEQEIIKSKLYLERRIEANEILKRFYEFLAVSSLFLFAGIAANPALNLINSISPDNKEKVTVSIARKDEINQVNQKANSSSPQIKRDSKNPEDKVIELIDKVSLGVLALMFIGSEVMLLLDTTKSKERLMIVKYALELGKKNSVS
jgi:hypothetical protein